MNPKPKFNIIFEAALKPLLSKFIPVTGINNESSPVGGMGNVGTVVGVGVIVGVAVSVGVKVTVGVAV